MTQREAVEQTDVGKTFDENIEWRNKYFERCDYLTGKRIEGAQDQSKDLD